MNKTVARLQDAVNDICDGATVLVGGFGLVGGTPSYLLRALAKRAVKNLTIVGNGPFLGRIAQETMARTMKVPDWFEDASVLLVNGQVSKMIISVPGMGIPGLPEPFPIVKALQEGQDFEIEIVPQGTLAEKIRAAKAGIPAFYSPVGVGTIVQKAKEVRTFGGKQYLLEHAIQGDFALIWAYKGDRYGNLVYRGASRTFNATMAGAAKVTIAEVEQLVDVGELDPEAVVTPAVYVDRVVVRPGCGNSTGGRGEAAKTKARSADNCVAYS